MSGILCPRLNLQSSSTSSRSVVAVAPGDESEAALDGLNEAEEGAVAAAAATADPFALQVRLIFILSIACA